MCLKAHFCYWSEKNSFWSLQYILKVNLSQEKGLLSWYQTVAQQGTVSWSWANHLVEGWFLPSQLWQNEPCPLCLFWGFWPFRFHKKGKFITDFKGIPDNQVLATYFLHIRILYLWGALGDHRTGLPQAEMGMRCPGKSSGMKGSHNPL